MIQTSFSQVLAVYGGLLVFGVLYNLLIHYLEKRGYLEGFVSIAVAAGCLVTVIGTALIVWQFAFLLLGAFVMSGSPMIVGSIYRYVRNRERSQRRMMAEVERANDR